MALLKMFIQSFILSFNISYTKKLNSFSVLLIFVSIFNVALAQEMPIGSWAGQLMLGSDSRHSVIFHFSEGADGKTTTLFDIPSLGFHSLQAQGAFGEDSVRFVIDTFGGRYSYVAQYRPDKQQMTGYFSVAGTATSFTLQISPTDMDSLRPNRPQTPQPPYPYRQWTVTFPGGSPDVVLSGSVTAPKGKKKVPGVILLSGSGPHNRDGEQFYHKTFQVLADELTRRGFAVLRYDERGVGASTGRYSGTTIEEFAQDAKAAVRKLRSDKRLKVKDVYLIGHSQGSLEAHIVAAQDPSVAGVVLLAGVGLSGVESSKAQYRALLKARGITEEQASQDLMMYDKSYEIVGQAPDSASAVAHLREWHKEIELASHYSQMYIAPFVDTWRFQFLHFDPAPYLQRIRVPVLFVGGDKDSQISVEKESEAIRAGLATNGNTKFQSFILPGLNHFMQTAKSGAYDEPYTLEETFAPKGLEVIGNWLEQQAQ